MAVAIRLSRWGSRKRPYYHIVVADKRAPRDGKHKEVLGKYNPMVEKDNPQRVVLDIEKIKYWLSVGAQPTDRVAKILADNGLLPKKEIPIQTKQSLPKAKAQERLKEQVATQQATKVADTPAPKETVIEEKVAKAVTETVVDKTVTTTEIPKTTEKKPEVVEPETNKITLEETLKEIPVETPSKIKEEIKDSKADDSSKG